jgi:hypothetical protein
MHTADATGGSRIRGNESSSRSHQKNSSRAGAIYNGRRKNVASSTHNFNHHNPARPPPMPQKQNACYRPKRFFAKAAAGISALHCTSWEAEYDPPSVHPD